MKGDCTDGGWTTSRTTAWGSAATDDAAGGYSGSFLGGGYYGYYAPDPVGEELRELLAPLLTLLREYDTRRDALEQRGGHVTELTHLTQVLTQCVNLEGRYGKRAVTLTDRAKLAAALHDLGGYDLHFDVRRLFTGMPVFYLCRTRSDYWAEYRLIVEDLYRSPGYPVTDDRFVKLMKWEHETYSLRLSGLRGGALALSAADPGEPERAATSWTRQRPSADAAANLAADRLLYTIGRDVLQAAWHEDQRLGVLVATHFGVPSFRDAVELVYLCLSGDLCDLRRAIRPNVQRFFAEVYPQPAIAAFLARLVEIDGKALADLPKAALQHYRRLGEAFGRFLSVPVAFGERRVELPLQKVVLGNVSRLDVVAAMLADGDALRAAVARLGEAAGAVVLDLAGEARGDPGPVTSRV